MGRSNKSAPPLHVPMPFDEAMQRVVRVKPEPEKRAKAKPPATGKKPARRKKRP